MTASSSNVWKQIIEGNAYHFEQGIWNVPTIHRNGKFVVFKNCFQIPVDWKIDRKLVKDLVHARLDELD